MTGPELLRRYMDDAGKSAADISRTTGGIVGEDELSRYLSGKRRPNIDHAHAIEEATSKAVPATAWSRYRPTGRNSKHRAA